jgi:hypothetical protein
MHRFDLHMVYVLYIVKGLLSGISRYERVSCNPELNLNPEYLVDNSF